MIALLQRVTHAGVSVAGECVAAMERGLLVLIVLNTQTPSAKPTGCSSGFSATVYLQTRPAR